MVYIKTKLCFTHTLFSNSVHNLNINIRILEYIKKIKILIK